MNTRFRDALLAVLSASVVYFCVSALLPDQRAHEASAAQTAPTAPVEGAATPTDSPVTSELADVDGASATVEPPAVASDANGSADGEERPLVLEAPRGTVVVGRVFERATGAAVSSTIDVSIGGSVRASVRTDGDGRFAAGPFEAAAFAAGPCEVVARPSDGFPTLVEAVLAIDEPLIRLDVPVDLWTRVTVRAIDASGAAAAPRIAAEYAPAVAEALRLVAVATRERPGDVLARASGRGSVTHGVGTFQSSREAGDVIGWLEVRERLPAWVSLVSSQQVIATQPLEPGAKELVFTLDPSALGALVASLRATFIDAATREPVAASVWIANQASPPAPPVGQANERGELVVSSAFPGTWTMTVRADGYAGLTRTIELARSGETDLGVIELHRPRTISGVVRDSTGQPQALRLQFTRIDGDPSGARAAWQVDSAPDGAFSLAGATPGLWAVATRTTMARASAETSLVATAVVADTRAGDATDVAVVVAPGTLVTVRLTRRAESEVRVDAFDAYGSKVSIGTVRALDREARLVLPPGTFELVASSRDVEITRRSISVGTEPFEVEFDVP